MRGIVWHDLGTYAILNIPSHWRLLFAIYKHIEKPVSLGFYASSRESLSFVIVALSRSILKP